MKIKLLDGYEILIDDEDYERFSKFKWRIGHIRKDRIVVRTHMKINGKYKIISLHRFIMNIHHSKTPPIDHVNRNTLDNRKCNLRICNNVENSLNRDKMKIKSYSKYKGPWFKPSKRSTSKCWESYCKYYGKNYYLGKFHTDIEAAKAYDKFALKNFPDFACINFPELKEQYLKEIQAEKENNKGNK